MTYTVRVTGTQNVWADIQVEADSVSEAQDKVSSTDPAFTADWQPCEGGNGVDDWVIADVFDENGDEVEEPEEQEA